MCCHMVAHNYVYRHMYMCDVHICIFVLAILMPRYVYLYICIYVLDILIPRPVGAYAPYCQTGNQHNPVNLFEHVSLIEVLLESVLGFMDIRVTANFR